MLGVGIYVQLKIGDYVELSSVKYVTGSIIIITVGAVIAVIAFFGCCGAIKENRCLLGMVSSSLIFLIYYVRACVCCIVFTDHVLVYKHQ